MLIGYVSFEWLPVIFENIEKLIARDSQESVLRDAYYVKMAIAWLVAECFIEFPEPTMGYLQVSKLPTWTFNKAISKICDSRRVPEDVKASLRKLRK